MSDNEGSSSGTAGQAILPNIASAALRTNPFPPRDQRQSARNTLDEQEHSELARDPDRKQCSFDFKYKEMRIKPKMPVLEGTKIMPNGAEELSHYLTHVVSRTWL